MILLAPVVLLAIGCFVGFLGLSIGGRVSQPMVIAAAVVTGAAMVLMVLAGHA